MGRNSKTGSISSQALPGDAKLSQKPCFLALTLSTNPPVSPLLKPHDRQNIDVILK